MIDSAELAVKRVISAMVDNIGEDFTIDDMARVAMFSKFHFSRMFQRATGVSPGRFLSALRLQRAKHLLVSTTFNIADISLRVGYTSVGTFSSRFSRSVGLSPTAYRRLGGHVTHIDVTSHTGGEHLGRTVRGRIVAHRPDRNQLVFIGAFRERIPEGRPVSCTVLDKAGPFVLENVPQGRWYLLAQSVSADPMESRNSNGVLVNEEISVSLLGPIMVRRDLLIEAEMRLKPADALDPPVLLALLDVRKAALEQVAERSHDVVTPILRYRNGTETAKAA